MSTLTYAQRIARNHYQNMVALPRRISIAPVHARGIDKAALNGGLRSVHALVSETYLLAARSPGAFHLPTYPDALPRAGGQYGGASRSFRRLPKLLFAIGLMGQTWDKGAKSSLAVPLDAFGAHCRKTGVTRLQQLLSDLGAAGMSSTPEAGRLMVRFPGTPATATGLSVFAKAARLYTAESRHPPSVFCRVDLRILASEDAALGVPKVTIDDVTRPLDEEQATVLRALAGHVETLGFRPKLKCSGLARGEWRGSYVNPKLGKTLFGFVVEENKLSVRFVLDTTPQIAPCAAALPERLRETVLRAGECRTCGRCKDGPIVIDLGGEKRRLCRNLWVTFHDVTMAEVEPLRQLAAAQDRILRERTVEL
ncbi:MAG: hypothetical protein HN742_28670 [Lentisphaerae bacterium]|mgnify:CR=1 FL=1|nr:hypothetical protein [Lentisphaerota bacterium]MBT4817833.1 hypothetical protein [Lentisphaerota bacterium]MBT5612238.1 hypothetical protein [Lentisphaerota bacterium]MBT7845881.1 hypothetical protein [Lentisphaerota bacterium]